IDMRSRIVLASALVFVTMAGSSVAGAIDFTPGSSGLGDPFFPLGGNGGYDVQHYGLDLSYDPHSNNLTGTGVIDAVATQNLSQFDLDLRGFTVASVEVDGVAAAFSRDGQELIIQPSEGLPSGEPFTVTVAYSGTPTVVTDPDGSIEGWVPTDD